MWRSYRTKQNIFHSESSYRKPKTLNHQMDETEDFSEEMEPIQMISSRRHSSDEDNLKMSTLKNSSMQHDKEQAPPKQLEASRTPSSRMDTGSIVIKEIMNDTSRTLINLQFEEERLTANVDSLAQSLMSVG